MINELAAYINVTIFLIGTSSFKEVLIDLFKQIFFTNVKTVVTLESDAYLEQMVSSKYKDSYSMKPLILDADPFLSKQSIIDVNYQNVNVLHARVPHLVHKYYLPLVIILE